MRYTRKGHCQAFKVNGEPCMSETGLGIVTTFNEGDNHVFRRWLCAAHCHVRQPQWQGRVRLSSFTDVGSTVDHCFVWAQGYGPEEGEV